MKFICFHVMPYRPLDVEGLKRYRSSWIFLPNSNYDQSIGADLYQEYIDQLVYCEELGFDGVAVNEHHQTAYGLMPAPNLIASILCQRTKSVQIAILGRALPLVNNPLNIAEELAMLDNLSRGRIIAGFVRGIGSEYHASGVNPTFSHARFHEAHDLILRAWTETGPFSFEGDHYNFSYVNIWPRPYQRPHPPVWIPSQGSAETIEWAAAPERRYPFAVTFSPRESIIKNLNLYRAQARRFGYEASPQQLGWCVPVYVADSDERAEREARAPLESLVNDYFLMPPEMLLPPGYTSLSSMKTVLEMRAGLIGKRQSFEDLLGKGNVVIGSPRSVREQFEKVRDVTQLGTILPVLQFGHLSNELARRNMELFASEVMPHLRD